MGVYIKGMEIPKCCTVCNIIDCKEYTTKNTRDKNCPMIDVPNEAGRLVSVLELIRIARQELPYSSYTDVLWLIAHTPTVIETEGKNERSRR